MKILRELEGQQKWVRIFALNGKLVFLYIFARDSQGGGVGGGVFVAREQK